MCATQGCGITPNYGRDGSRTHCAACKHDGMSLVGGRTREPAPVPRSAHAVAIPCTAIASAHRQTMAHVLEVVGGNHQRR